MTDPTPLDRARRALAEARAAIVSEISSYPAPIAGCDAQFNHLLDCRRRIERARAALDTPEFVPTPRAPSPAEPARRDA